ncbi:MAG: DUF805 domain-containing protein [Actinomycetota bacterium]
MEHLTGKGRIGRLRYFGTGIVLGFFAFVALTIGAAIDGDRGLGFGALLMFMTLPVLFWVSITAAIRRLHDLNMTGWLVLVMLIPIIGSLFQLFLLLAPGSPSDNRYGPPFGGQPTLSLAEHRVQAAQIRQEAADAYARRNG